jgi:hypothetical protein
VTVWNVSELKVRFFAVAGPKFRVEVSAGREDVNVMRLSGSIIRIEEDGYDVKTEDMSSEDSVDSEGNIC